jgi:16S rRNA (cytosine1402-N4)-methyltransferase
MRMDQHAELDAVGLLNTYSIEDLTNIFKLYGELNNAWHLANDIVSYRKRKSIEKVSDLLEAIKNHTPKTGDYAFLSKVFQAIRIEVNQEMQVLEKFLEQCNVVLKPKGRLVIMTYHSLEDRIVKNYLAHGNFNGEPVKDAFGNLIRPFKPINNKVIVPDAEEINRNKRARSAKLRIAEKI